MPKKNAARPKEQPTKKERGCPYSGETGFVVGQRVRKAWSGGWLVLYDRASGCAALDAGGVKWTAATQWVVLWKPHGKRFKAFATEAEARSAVWATVNGDDKLGWFQPRAEPATTPAPAPAAPAPSTEIVAVEVVQPGAVAAAGGAPGRQPVATLPMPKRLSHNAEFQQKIFEWFPIEKVLEGFKDATQATRSWVTGGEVFTEEDWKLRFEAYKAIAAYQVGVADKMERLREAAALDTSHLEDMLLRSAAARQELRALLDELDRTNPVDYDL